MDELQYFGTRDNPTQIAEDDEQKLDVTLKNELSSVKNDLLLLLNNMGLNTNQPAMDVKIEAIANEKVYKIIYPIIEKLDNKIKGATK